VKARTRRSGPSGTPSGIVGRTITVNARIVGIVANTSTGGVGEEDGAVLYQPLSATGRWSRAPTAPILSVLVGLSGEPRAVADAVRADARELDPQLTVVPETIAQTIRRQADQYAIVVTLTAVPAGVALLLSVIGIYGVTAFIVTQRRREIGIRIALGARVEDVVRLFVWSLRRSLVVGVVGGGLLGAFGAWWLRVARLLPVTGMSDRPWVFATALTIVVTTTVIASAVPAFRAARANSWSVLRDE
jgi:putative ABC transport system permease protein